MPVGLHIIARYEGPIEGKMRDFYPVLTKALRAEAEFWRDKILPGHFKAGAARKYGYKPRAGTYTDSKRAALAKGRVYDSKLRINVPLGDPQLPALVWTGRTRGLMTSQSRLLVFGKKVSLRMKAPSYIFQAEQMTQEWAERANAAARKNAFFESKSKAVARPPMVNEIVRMTPDEQADQMARIQDSVQALLVRRTPVEVRKIA